jgi:hypothetical protein
MPQCTSTQNNNKGKNIWRKKKATPKKINIKLTPITMTTPARRSQFLSSGNNQVEETNLKESICWKPM